MKIRIHDKVEIMSGKEKDRGERAEVLRIFVNKDRVLVKGINIATKHMKKSGTTPGQIIKIEKSIHTSSVMLVCPFTDKPTRIGFVKVLEKGKTKKFRFSKRALKDLGGEAKKYIIK